MKKASDTPHFALKCVQGIKPSASLSVLAPFDLKPLATVDALDEQGVSQVLESAHQAYLNRASWLPAYQRIHILNTAAKLLAERKEAFARRAAQEGGKPLLDSRIELDRAVDGLRNCAELLRNEKGETIPMGITPASEGRLAFTQSEPIGVVLAVSAFNHPVNLVVHQIGPAIAAGCPVVIKPAEATPLSCLAMVDLFREAGLPDVWAQAILTQNHETTRKMVADERVAYFSFIGSAKVGWELRRLLAAGTRCALEHGGVAPVVVDESVDVPDVVPLLAKGGFYHGGQVCVSVQRIFAHHSIANELAKQLAAFAKTQTVGDPVSDQTDIGPLIRTGETERVQQWVDEAVAQGGTCLTGGHKISDSCYPPTVLLDVPMQCRVNQAEIFAPVVVVNAYQDLEEAVDRVNSLDYAFQAAVFSQSLDTALSLSQTINASSVMINDHTAFRVDWMPFAGLKSSGLGVGGIPYSFKEMRVQKLVVINLN